MEIHTLNFPILYPGIFKSGRTAEFFIKNSDFWFKFTDNSILIGYLKGKNEVDFNKKFEEITSIIELEIEKSADQRFQEALRFRK